MAGFAWLAVLKAEFSTLPEPELSTLPRQTCTSEYQDLVACDRIASTQRTGKAEARMGIPGVSISRLRAAESRSGMVLVIREAQMTMMRNAALSSFRRRLGTHVRSFLPNAGEGEISTVVDRVVRDCAAYSLERECDIARYATIILRDGSCAGGCRLRKRTPCWRTEYLQKSGCLNSKD
jgi:hypothetical protein